MSAAATACHDRGHAARSDAVRERVGEAVPRRAAAGPWRRAAGWLRRLPSMLERRRQRRRLLALAGNPDFLRDVGLSQADALREGSRPFWRD